ncbi:MAG TPA: GNAT family N-acetyltransferase, partial [Solirubrobacteraceae bacterium]|nr:GNAT family N-acetyltransferase [Solirubrobacteraceae bacterium]
MTAIGPARGLSPAQLEAIAALERRVVAHDGGRLKLEWGRLSTRPGDRAQDMLAWDGQQLVGFAGLYGHGPPQIELAGMVDPAHRRRGIGGRLLDGALALAAAAGAHEPLLIVPRGSVGGGVLAAHHGAALDHSEHALLLRGEPVDGPSDPLLTMRSAERRDVPAITALMSSGFGFAPPDVAERLTEEGVRSLVFEREGMVVGTLRAALTGENAGVYGFVVEARLRGRGIGRDALRRACHALREGGASTVGLEVEVENDRALRLYTTLGFELV